IPRAGNRLYDNGLSPIRSGFIVEPNSHKRFRLLITAITLSHLLRAAYFGYDYLTKNENNERLVAIYLGDLSYYLPSVKIHWVISCFNFYLFTLFSQLHIISFQIAKPKRRRFNG